MKSKATVTISKKELSEIIKDYLVSKNVTPISDVKYKYGKRLEGYGLSEYEASYFDGCSVDIEIDLFKGE